MHLVDKMAYIASSPVPWHKNETGENTQEVPEDAKWDISRFIVYAGLDWKVKKASLTRALPSAPFVANMDEWAFATVRESDDKTLGIVGSRYEVYQNIDAFSWFQPFLDSGEVYLETAGALMGGSRVWILARIGDGAEIVKGDGGIQRRLLLAHAHDGSLKIIGKETNTYVVCNNTLSAALPGYKHFSFKHTKNAQTALEEAWEALAASNKDFQKVHESYQFLASRKANEQQAREYVKRVFAMAEDDAKLATRSKNMLTEIMNRIDTGIGSQLAHGTWWRAYNGVTEYLTHERGHNDDSKLNSLWFGDSGKKTDEALRMALELAKVA